MNFCEISDNALWDLKEAFEADVTDDVIAVKESMGEGTFNSKHGLRWDLIYRNVTAAGRKHGMVNIPNKRGIWEFEILVNLVTKDALIFMKEANSDVTAKKNGHYLNCTLTKNTKHDNKNFNVNLFEDEDNNAYRRKICQSVLGDYFEIVEQVIVVSLYSVPGASLSTTLKLYNSSGAFVAEQVITKRPNPEPTGKLIGEYKPIDGMKLKPSVNMKNEEKVN